MQFLNLVMDKLHESLSMWKQIKKVIMFLLATQRVYIRGTGVPEKYNLPTSGHEWYPVIFKGI